MPASTPNTWHSWVQVRTQRRQSRAAVAQRLPVVSRFPFALGHMQRAQHLGSPVLGIYPTLLTVGSRAEGYFLGHLPD